MRFYFHRVFFSRYVEPVEEVQGKTQTQCFNLGITVEDGILFKYRARLRIIIKPFFINI